MIIHTYRSQQKRLVHAGQPFEYRYLFLSMMSTYQRVNLEKFIRKNKFFHSGKFRPVLPLFVSVEDIDCPDAKGLFLDNQLIPCLFKDSISPGKTHFVAEALSEPERYEVRSMKDRNGLQNSRQDSGNNPLPSLLGACMTDT